LGLLFRYGPSRVGTRASDFFFLWDCEFSFPVDLDCPGCEGFFLLFFLFGMSLFDLPWGRRGPPNPFFDPSDTSSLSRMIVVRDILLSPGLLFFRIPVLKGLFVCSFPGD